YKTRDPLIRSSFLNPHSALLALGGRYEEAHKSAAMALEFSNVYGLVFANRYAQFQLAVSLFGLRDFRRSQSLLRQCEAAAISGDDAFLRVNIGTLRGRVYLAIGANREATETFETYRQLHSTHSMEGELLAWWSLALAAIGESRAASAIADE